MRHFPSPGQGDDCETRTAKIRVLIVDDSGSMRRLIRLSLGNDPDIDIVAEAANAREARDAVNRYNPDVMTLDVEMPEMDGLEFLRRLMKARPMPVVMVSSLTNNGSMAAIKALSLGAVECVAKPAGISNAGLFPGLAAKLKLAAAARIRPRLPAGLANNIPRNDLTWGGKIVVVGASTGGVDAIEVLLSGFPESCPPTLITQHMPQQYLKSFAARLDRLCAPDIRIATDREPLSQGKVRIAPGGEYHLGLGQKFPFETILIKGPKQSGHRPSVDVLFHSAVAFAPKSIAVLLTGMGSDGADGMVKLRQAGSFCIAQDEDSSVIYGMARVAAERGGVDVTMDLGSIAETVLARTSVSCDQKLMTNGQER
ncbi:MAG TPA: chemotaxis-specific protein-glutamate methyltransferase CheB [Aliiroseovarius sp.]|nr:chemotaxis-specific protein-glutamate methyltransferase CheB [Aliiroseovarius sp.]